MMFLRFPYPIDPFIIHTPTYPFKCTHTYIHSVLFHSPISWRNVRMASVCCGGMDSDVQDKGTEWERERRGVKRKWRRLVTGAEKVLFTPFHVDHGQCVTRNRTVDRQDQNIITIILVATWANQTISKPQNNFWSPARQPIHLYVFSRSPFPPTIAQHPCAVCEVRSLFSSLSLSLSCRVSSSSQ